jgi:hypothetical protein
MVEAKQYPFEVSPGLIEAKIEVYVDAVFSCLESEFLIMPKGPDFVEYNIFQDAYEALKKTTSSFHKLDTNNIMKLVGELPLSLTVLRTMLGLTPPEWAYIASQETGTQVTQAAARTIDREIRARPVSPMNISGTKEERIKALVEVACSLLGKGVPSVQEDKLHRLNKADTKEGLASIKARADIGVPYAMLLYERFLGRPFAGHRDSVSELIGEGLEEPIERLLVEWGISYRKTKRAEKIEGFDQAPDFIIPDEFSPKVVIEAKITEDDGTARDKVTRIQHLAEISTAWKVEGKTGFEVIACIGGRGFGVRREDMKKLIKSTKGKVFTMQTLERMVECSDLKGYASATSAGS